MGQPVETTGPHHPEVADILRDHAHGLRLTRQQARAVRDIVACRTAALGGNLEFCPACGFSRPAYRSCRNRHCPKCQILKQELWAEAQEALLLPCHYFQVIFTLAAELHPLFRAASALCLNLLFQAVSETLLEVARTQLHAAIGFTLVLHTWTQKLLFHPHIHCIVPGGGLADEHSRWISCSKRFFLPVDILRYVFRGKLLQKLELALRDGTIPFQQTQGLALLKRASMKTWVVEVKRPLDGPRHVVRYLSRYVHRIAISNSRILAYDGKDVLFRYKDRADGSKTKTLPLSGEKFSRRFLAHVLPDRFVRIRHYGLLAARCRKDLARCRQLLGTMPSHKHRRDEGWVAAFERLFGWHPLLCPRCRSAHLIVQRVLPPLRL